MTAQPGTRVLKADRDAIEAAARCLAEGGLVAFPTETVYGLGADAGQWRGRRPALRGQGAPLVQSIDRTRRGYRRRTARGSLYARCRKTGGGILAGPADSGAGEAAGLRRRRSRARRSRHGGRARAGASGCARTSRRHSTARSSRHRPTAQDMFRRRAPRMCSPICAAASISSSTPAHARSAWNRQSCLAPTSPLCCGRAGSRAKRSNAHLGATLATAAPTDEAPMAPGMLTSHYAPKATLRLDADAAQPGEALLAFGPAPILSRYNVQPCRHAAT